MLHKDIVICNDSHKQSLFIAGDTVMVVLQHPPLHSLLFCHQVKSDIPPQLSAGGCSKNPSQPPLHLAL